MEPSCKNCPFCDVITDEEYQKNLKCMKTSKKGRTITWSMCCVGQNVYQYFADYLEKHDRPNWCPRAKEKPVFERKPTFTQGAADEFYEDVPNFGDMDEDYKKI